MMCCRDCLFFNGRYYPCALSPLGVVDPDTEFCNKFEDVHPMRKH